MEAADDRTTALRAIAWVLVGWAVAIAAIALAYELEYERMLDAIHREPHRALLAHIAGARGVVDAVVALVVVGIAVVRRQRAAALVAVAFAAVGLMQLTMWVRPELAATRWLFALRIGAGAAGWLAMLLALARLPTGRSARVAVAGAAAALVLWRYGVPLVAGLFGGLAMPETRPLLWIGAQAAAILGVGAAVGYLARGANRASAPGDWANAADGLTLTATALIIRLCIGIFGFVAAVVTARWGSFALGALSVVSFGGIVITELAAAGGMARAAASPSRPAGIAAGATVALLLLAIALDLHALWPSTRFTYLPVAALLTQVGVLLTFLTHVRRSALACHHADRARQAAVLAYIVVALGMLAGVLAAWAPGSANGRALLRDVGFLVFSIALLVGVVLVLAITRTAHRLAGEMKSGSLPPTAVARTASSERSPQETEERA